MIVTTAEFGWKGGGRPGHPVFTYDVENHFARQIAAGISDFIPSRHIVEMMSLEPATGLVGRYAVSTNRERWFVRVSARIGDRHLESEVINFLYKKGVSVNPICFSHVLSVDNNRTYRIDVRPFLDGRHFSDSSDDFDHLINVVLALHDAMKTIPCNAKIKHNAHKRYQQLRDVTHMMKHAFDSDDLHIFGEQNDWAKHNTGWFLKMMDECHPCLDDFIDAQPLHGELHTGNVIFVADTPVLIDFEESVHVYAPPAWDIAFLLQRFWLHSSQSLSAINGKMKLLTDTFDIDSAEILYMMRQAAWLSMAIIMDLQVNHHVVTPASEYQKFVDFEVQARQLERLL